MDTTTLELLKLGVTTLASVVAAAFAIRIAKSQRDISNQQKNIAREAKEVAAAKLNFDLFKERYELFYEVWRFMSDGEGRLPTSSLRTEFTNLIPKAKFLFGDEIAEYMREADRRRTAFMMANLDYARDQDPQAANAIREHDKWFFDNATKCYEKFGRYLDFSEWQAQRWTEAVDR